VSSRVRGPEHPAPQCDGMPPSHQHAPEGAIPDPHLACLASDHAGCERPAKQCAKLLQWGNLLALLLLAVLVFAPHFMDFQKSPSLGLPHVLSGDEPHYLLILNSLLNDGDLELYNNYASVHDGSSQAGKQWGGYRYLNHHTRILVDGESHVWPACFPMQVNPSSWERNALGYLQPPPLPHGPRVPVGAQEYSAHPSGIAFLLAPFLLPFRGTSLLEPAAVLCTGFAVFLGALFFRTLLRGYTSSAWTINIVTIICFISTPIWFYGRSFFMEPFLMLFALGAYTLALRQGRALGAGSMIALGMQLKPHFAILALPLLIDSLARKQHRKIDAMLLPIAVSAALVLLMNRAMYGSLFTPPQPFVFGSFREGLFGLLFSAQFGLFFFAPSVLLAALCWPRFAFQHPRESVILMSGFMIQYIMMALCIFWDGWCYGPRHLVPVLPFLFVPLVKLPELSLFRSFFMKGLICAVLAVSFLTNGIGALNYGKYWVHHPLIEWLQEHKPGSVPSPLLHYYVGNLKK
jgi:hypothetical protein